MHLVKYDPYNLIYSAHFGSINDTFFQVILNTNDRHLYFDDLSFFHCTENKDLLSFIESIKHDILHIFICFEEYSKKGCVFLVADPEDKSYKLPSKKLFIFGSKFDNKDQMIWSLAPAEILMKQKTIYVI